MAQSLGQLLLNDVIPAQHRVSETLDKGSINKKLTSLAKEDPVAYVDIVGKLKKLGDEVATLEGISVGIDDVKPDYKTRDAIIKPAVEKIKHAKSADEREKIILDVQERMLAHTKTHPGTMTQMALSGARGNIPQLMKTVASPVAAVDAKGKITPWLIGRAYSEGLSPADYWVAGNEARINTVRSTTAVAEPGDVAKIMVNTLYPLVITQEDCGTHNGIMMPVGDGHILGRYLAADVGKHKRNDLVTPTLIADLRKDHTTVKVRSPLTCEAHEGVCLKCQGLDEKGNPHPVGVNVGVRAAQALSEPLTQFVLNAKHGVRVLKGASQKLEGLTGVRQLLEIPQSFFNKAALAEKAGTVEKIEPAPHGGTYVHVAGIEHYVPPNLNVTVRPGQKVEAGDILSEGVPKPDELLKHKGLGVGRKYLVDTMHDLYKGQGIDLDKRHLELLARADLNHVKVLNPGSHPEFLRGDIVPYDHYKEVLGQAVKEIPLEQAHERVLGSEVLHFTAGTPLNESVIATLKEHGVKKVPVAEDPPDVEFVMKPITRAPLLNPDWMARLAHRYLKDSLLKGAHTGESSNRHGVHPVPAYAYGAEFGAGNDGRY